MSEQKTLDFVMQKKQRNAQMGPRLTMIGRERTRSRPRDRRSEKEFESRFVFDQIYFFHYFNVGKIFVIFFLIFTDLNY